MRILNNSTYEITVMDDGIEILKRIERAARISYKSEPTETSYKTFVKKLMDSHHDSCLEHGGMISVVFVSDRGVDNEIVRHRISSFNQESTRYANYSKDKFGNEITVINPFLIEDSESFRVWMTVMECCEWGYMELLKLGNTPQIARSVLPLGLASEIIVSTNPREWRHIFKLRTDKAAHPQIRDLMSRLLKDFQNRIPILFDDI